MRDPKNQVKCVITNNDQYDEKAGRTFDDPKIKALNPKFENNMDAMYNLSTPPTDNKVSETTRTIDRQVT